MSVNLEEYESRLPMWREVEQEAVYTLREAIVTAGVKIHVIEHRIKDLISLIGKAASKSHDYPLKEIKDIVGLRVVTLFLSDLPKIDAIISNELLIISKDDKTTGDDSAVGYRSVHYIAHLNQSILVLDTRRLPANNSRFRSERFVCMLGQQFRTT